MRLGEETVTEEKSIDTTATTDSGTADHASDHSSDRHDNERHERGQSVRDLIKSAWRHQTGEEPQDRQDREERRPKREDRRKEWEPRNRAGREATAPDARVRDGQHTSFTTAEAASSDGATETDNAPPAAWARASKGGVPMTIPPDRSRQNLMPAPVDRGTPANAGRWQPGVSGNPRGRPVGAKGRFSEALVSDFASEWREHGPEVIATVRQKDPVAFLQIATRLLPKEFLVQSERPASIENLTDEELEGLIEALRDVPKIHSALRLLVAKVGELGPEGEALKAEVEALYRVVGYVGDEQT
jgi:hypothetical protein